MYIYIYIICIYIYILYVYIYTYIFIISHRKQLNGNLKITTFFILTVHEQLVLISSS